MLRCYVRSDLKKTPNFINRIAIALNCGLQPSPAVINDKNQATSAAAGHRPDQNLGWQLLYRNTQTLAEYSCNRPLFTLFVSGKSYSIF